MSLRTSPACNTVLPRFRTPRRRPSPSPDGGDPKGVDLEKNITFEWLKGLLKRWPLGDLCWQDRPSGSHLWGAVRPRLAGCGRPFGRPGALGARQKSRASAEVTLLVLYLLDFAWAFALVLATEQRNQWSSTRLRQTSELLLSWYYYN